MPDAMTDAQLALLSQRGDRRAFSLLARRWDRGLYRFVRRMVGDAEEARDVCQETLLKAYLNIGRLREPEHFKSWLHQIGLNLCRDRGGLHRDGKGLEIAPLEESDAENRPAPLPSPLQEAERADLAAILEQALARLPEDQRTAILLGEVEGFTSQEIARITGGSASTIRSRIFYGLKALRRMLPEYGITEEHLKAMEVPST